MPRIAHHTGHRIAAVAVTRSMTSDQGIVPSLVVHPRVAEHAGAPPTVPIPIPATVAAEGRDLVGVVHLHTTVGRQVTGRTVRPIPPPPPPATDVVTIFTGTVRLRGTGGCNAPWPRLFGSPIVKVTVAANVGRIRVNGVPLATGQDAGEEQPV